MKVHRRIQFPDHGSIDIWEDKGMYSIDMYYDYNSFPVTLKQVSKEKADDIAARLLEILRDPDCVAAEKVEPS